MQDRIEDKLLQEIRSSRMSVQPLQFVFSQLFHGLQLFDKRNVLTEYRVITLQSTNNCKIPRC